MSEIEGCPWCRAPGQLNTSNDREISWVSCPNGQCKAQGPREWSPEQAVETWNTRPQSERVSRLEEALKASLGHLMNAKIDLETGAPKATAIRTIEGGIRRARSALNQSDGGGNG
jgi:hypothetical protein